MGNVNNIFLKYLCYKVNSKTQVQIKLNNDKTYFYVIIIIKLKQQ